MAVPKYRMSEKTYIHADNTAEAWMYDAGAEIFYSGTPSRNFIALNPEAEAALALLAPLTAMAENILPRRGDPAP
jgi:hypothetical protein